MAHNLRLYFTSETTWDCPSTMFSGCLCLATIFFLDIQDSICVVSHYNLFKYHIYIFSGHVWSCQGVAWCRHDGNMNCSLDASKYLEFLFASSIHCSSSIALFRGSSTSAARNIPFLCDLGTVFDRAYTVYVQWSILLYFHRFFIHKGSVPTLHSYQEHFI